MTSIFYLFCEKILISQLTILAQRIHLEDEITMQWSQKGNQICLNGHPNRMPATHLLEREFYTGNVFPVFFHKPLRKKDSLSLLSPGRLIDRQINKQKSSFSVPGLLHNPADRELHSLLFVSYGWEDWDIIKASLHHFCLSVHLHVCHTFLCWLPSAEGSLVISKNCLESRNPNFISSLKIPYMWCNECSVTK